MKDMILFPEDIDRMNLVLSQLVMKANLLLAVLINKDGRLLTSQGSLDQVDTVSMAALVAGNSASTLAIAQLMGESEFSTMYHQGKEKNIYIAIVDDNTFLSLVFDDRTNIDRVKVFARQFDRQLKASLAQVYNKTEDQINLDLDIMGSFNSTEQEQASFYSPQQPPQPNISQAYYEQQQVPHFDPLKEQSKVNYDTNIPPHDRSNQNSSYDNTVSSNDEEAIFDIDTSKNISNVNDTNYIYLQNKIKETKKRKKEE